MSLKVEKLGQSCGAQISGIDLKKELSESTIKEIREHWLKHHILSFPDQALSIFFTKLSITTLKDLNVSIPRNGEFLIKCESEIIAILNLFI